MERKNVIIYASIFVLVIVLAGVWAGTTIFHKQEASAYFQKAIQLKAEGENKWKETNVQGSLADYEKALAMFQLIAKRYPEWKTEAGSLPDLIKSCEEAIKSCGRAKRTNEATVIINRGHAYLEKQKYNEALSEYKIVLDEYKDIPRNHCIAQVYTGIVCQQIGQQEEAIKRYKIVLDEHSDQAELCAIAQTYLGVAYYQLGDYENALSAYKAALKINREYRQLSAQSLAGIGEIYRTMGKYEEARSAFKELIAQYPDSIQAKAIANVIDVLPLESWKESIDQSANIKQGVAITQKFLSDQISQKDFQRMLVALDEKNKNDALYVIGLKYQTKGELEEAKKYYKECVEMSTKDGDQDVAYQAAVKALEEIAKQEND